MIGITCFFVKLSLGVCVSICSNECLPAPRCSLALSLPLFPLSLCLFRVNKCLYAFFLSYHTHSLSPFLYISVFDSFYLSFHYFFHYHSVSYSSIGLPISIFFVICSTLPGCLHFFLYFFYLDPTVLSHFSYLFSPFALFILDIIFQQYRYFHQFLLVSLNIGLSSCE